MPDDDAADTPHAPRKPDWLPDATLAAMEQALHRATAFGRDGRRAAEDVREVARAHFPAATMAMIEEAVASVVPDPQGPARITPEWQGEGLFQASVDELVGSIGYGLRFDERGKARRTGAEFTATLAAAQIVRQLTMSGYLFFKRPPTGRACGGSGPRPGHRAPRGDGTHERRDG